MNFSASEHLLSRQRCRQWAPLVSQQLRLRHLYQLIGFNITSPNKGSFYFTLHLTTMSAPFYTSERISAPNPKWEELDIRSLPNTSISAFVIRIWQTSNNSDSDSIITTWGVNLSGLVYLGSKITLIQPCYFKANSLIFHMQGGYFASLETIRNDLDKAVPFTENMNITFVESDKRLVRQFTIGTTPIDIRDSYNVEKLRKLHSLQLEIRNKLNDVEGVINKINVKKGLNGSGDNRENVSEKAANSSQDTGVRYATQLLTMNSLNKMLEEKPTKYQKQEMLKLINLIELSKYRTKVLSMERNKKTANLRQLYCKLEKNMEENEERNAKLMESYYILHKEIEKLDNFRTNLYQNNEFLNYLTSQLQFRRKELLKEVFFIYPITKHGEKYKILNVHLPTIEELQDCSDVGISVALGYITHVLIMCSSFLQIPLQYPLTHYGSRSSITDVIQERIFPLYTKGKDRVFVTIAVHLLNRNIAQLRWLFQNHVDRRPTLPSLLMLLDNDSHELNKESLPPPPRFSFFHEIRNRQKSSEDLSRKYQLPVAAPSHRFVSVKNSFDTDTNVSGDPILDCLKQQQDRTRLSSSNSSPKRFNKQKTQGRDSNPGLSEILAIPEAFLNRQISSKSLRNFAKSDLFGAKKIDHDDLSSSLGACSTNKILALEHRGCDTLDVNIINSEPIEQGTDPLTDQFQSTSASYIPNTKNSSAVPDLLPFFSFKSDSMDLGNNAPSCSNYGRISRSYEDNIEFDVKPPEPPLNVFNNEETDEKSVAVPEQNSYLLNWLENVPNLVLSNDKDQFPDEILAATARESNQSSNPLTARTDALLSTKSFNLVKPK